MKKIKTPTEIAAFIADYEANRLTVYTMDELDALLQSAHKELHRLHNYARHDTRGLNEQIDVWQQEVEKIGAEIRARGYSHGKV